MADLRSKMRDKSKGIWEGAKYTSIGLEFGLGIALGYWLGSQVDERYGFSPYGGMIGLLLGFASGLRSLMKIAKIQEQQAQRELEEASQLDRNAKEDA
jgi:F0F1-type ATP synthase assembly protein I